MLYRPNLLANMADSKYVPMEEELTISNRTTTDEVQFFGISRTYMKMLHRRTQFLSSISARRMNTCRRNGSASQ